MTSTLEKKSSFVYQNCGSTYVESKSTAVTKERFDALWRESEPALLAVATKLTDGRWADADDLLGEALVDMWVKFEQFKPGTNFVAWGTGFLENEAQKWRQSRARALPTVSLTDLLNEERA